MITLDESEKKKADAKAALRYLTDHAKKLSQAMGEHFAAGAYSLAYGDAKELAEVMAILSRMDLR